MIIFGFVAEVRPSPQTSRLKSLSRLVIPGGRLAPMWLGSAIDQQRKGILSGLGLLRAGPYMRLLRSHFGDLDIVSKQFKTAGVCTKI